MLTVAVAFLTIGLIGYLLKKGLPYVNRAFLFTEPDILMDSYGIKPMLINTIYTVVLTLIFCIPLGIGSAIYLAEYAKQGKIVSGIRFAIEILAGIPSIVYGLFGLNFFVRKMAIGDYAGSMLSASLTLTLIVLPTMIRTTEESLLAVSQTYREAAIATGMSKFYMIRKIILPCAISGIVVAIILSIGRMVSESAALLYTAGIAQDLPSSVMSHVTEPGATMTVQLYLYATEGGAPEWVPYAMAAVLMVFVLFIEILTNVIAELADSCEIALIPVDAKTVDKLKLAYSSYETCEIPANTYNGQTEQVATVGVKALLLASEKMSDETAEELTRQLFAHATEIEYATSLKEIADVNAAVDGVQIPFHPGAKAYYASQGISVDAQEN